MSRDLPPISPDDDALRHAARLAWGNAAAPASLHQRVQMAMTRTVLEEPAIPTSTRSRRFWDAWPRPVQISSAVAALLVIAVGASWALINYQDRRPSYAVRTPDFAAPAPKPSLFAMLVSRHDDFAAGSESDAAPTGSEQSLRDALAAQLHHGVWAPDLAKLGWKLASVRVYPINGVSAVAFNFTRNGDSLSAFSLPVSLDAAGCSTGMPDVDEILDNRSVAAFSADNELFALVGSRGSAPLPQSELRSLLTQFRNDPACRSGCTP